MSKSFWILLFAAFDIGCISSQTEILSMHDTIRVVSVKELPGGFSYGDTIELTLMNESGEMLYYSVSLEEKTGDQWIVVTEDLFRSGYDKHKNLENIKVLLPFEEKTHRWRLDETFFGNQKPLGLCRFRCLIKESPFQNKATVYSGSFLLY